ncbi:hypothetical protein LEMLEM_LOCUS22936 [Lemmus lemmus]
MSFARREEVTRRQWCECNGPQATSWCPWRISAQTSLPQLSPSLKLLWFWLAAHTSLLSPSRTSTA